MWESRRKNGREEDNNEEGLSMQDMKLEQLKQCRTGHEKTHH